MYQTTVGQKTLPHFIYNAAGVWDTTRDQCNELDDTQHCGAVVTKSCTLERRDGNEYPKYHFSEPGYSINSNGLENRGLEYYLNCARLTKKPIFLSIGGMSDDERIEMLKITTAAISNRNKAIGIELNLSCPNVGCPGAAYNAEQLDTTLQSIFENVRIRSTFGLKLPPYYLPGEFEGICKVLQKYKNKIDFITCINSIPNGLDFDIDNNNLQIKPNDGYGGVGGPALLPVGLANVRRFKELFKEYELDISIIGCGGVTTGVDAYKYVLAGADAIQVGTHLWKNGPTVFEQVSKEFQHIMNRKGYTSLRDIPSIF